MKELNMRTEVTASMVKTLRERTGVGMAKCKEALDEAHGDIEAAIDILRKAGAASAVKKSSRETNEGLIGSKENAQAIALVQVNAETDFVIKNEKFLHFVETLTEDALAQGASSLESFMEEKTKSGVSHEEMRVELVQTIGENIQVRKVQVLPKKPNSSYGLYRHLGGKIVTYVEIAGSDKMDVLAKDVAMHIAAEAPEYLRQDEIPEDVVARERDIASSQLKGKPAEMVEKILVGKMKAHAIQVCLLDQKFIKDTNVSIEQHVEAEGKKVGAKLEVVKFLRWEVGAS